MSIPAFLNPSALARMDDEIAIPLSPAIVAYRSEQPLYSTYILIYFHFKAFDTKRNTQLRAMYKFIKNDAIKQNENKERR